MYKVSKKDLKIVGSVYLDLVQLQVEDYCPESYRIVVINATQFIEENDED